MNIFTYNLPTEKIAQRPAYPYDSAKLLVIKRATGELIESKFSEITNFLLPTDLLVFNESKVIPARLFAKTESGANVEILLSEKLEEGREQVSEEGYSFNFEIWNCLAKPHKKLPIGKKIFFNEKFLGIVEKKQSEKFLQIKFIATEKYSSQSKSISELLFNYGSMPIPPYIRKGISDDQDKADYQFHLANCEKSGSIAAPTASLHFTESLLNKIKNHGCSIEKVVLHVGSASFLPVYSNETDNFVRPSAEKFFVSNSVLNEITNTRKNTGRVIAVGTTVVRALESAANNFLTDLPHVSNSLTNIDQISSTEIFIQPGYSFKNLDALVTNFHQPGTSHMLLVESLLGRELIKKAYDYALSNDFRFLSYGDGMLIV